jgi:hypothetical protein
MQVIKKDKILKRKVSKIICKITNKLQIILRSTLSIERKIPGLLEEKQVNRNFIKLE